MNQATLRESVTFEGVGIHTGQPCRLTVSPAPENRGRVFLTAGGVEIPAHVDYVVTCDRSTVLGRGESRVHTPEHLLSAMAACGIDNAVMEMSGPEVPILDGSAVTFHRTFVEAGLREQGEPARRLAPRQPISVYGPEGELVLVLPSASTIYEYILHYDHPMVGCQQVVFRPETDDYGSQIAPARTFALWEEVQPLLERGLARGGGLDNALVIHRDKYSTPLKVENEPVRHKCLDLIGDLALLDARIQARVVAVKAGHKFHVECAKKVWEEMSVHERA